MSTMKYDMLDAAYIQAVKDAGYEVQASIFPTPHEQRALMDKVTIELSDFYWHQTDGRKSIDSFRKKNVKLAEGETVDWTVKAPDYSAIILDTEFSGTLEIDICGRVYTLEHGGETKVERFGMRLYKTDPQIKIKALSSSVVKSVKAELYDCGPR